MLVLRFVLFSVFFFCCQFRIHKSDHFHRPESIGNQFDIIICHLTEEGRKKIRTSNPTKLIVEISSTLIESQKSFHFAIFICQFKIFTIDHPTDTACMQSNTKLMAIELQTQAVRCAFNLTLAVCTEEWYSFCGGYDGYDLYI